MKYTAKLTSKLNQIFFFNILFFTIKLLYSFSYNKAYKPVSTYIYVGETMVRHLYIEIDENIHLKLKAKAYAEGKTISETVKKLIEKYVNGEISL